MRKLCTVSLAILLVSGCVSQNHTSEGIRYYGQARYDAALTAFQSELKAKPNDPNTLYNIAATYHQSAKSSLLSGQTATGQQQYELAAQYYKLCLAQNPNHADTHRGLASLYMDCRDGESAYQLLNGWCQANPVSIEPKIELARYYQEFAQICTIQGDLDAAQKCLSATEQLLQQVVATEPTNYRALRAMGYLKEQRGDVAGAVFEYQRSLQAYPKQKDLEERVAALIK